MLLSLYILLLIIAFVLFGTGIATHNIGGDALFHYTISGLLFALLVFVSWNVETMDYQPSLENSTINHTYIDGNITSTTELKYYDYERTISSKQERLLSYLCLAMFILNLVHFIPEMLQPRSYSR